MASETKISFNNKGFWIHEQFIEILSEYVCETFEAIGLSGLSPNLQEIYDKCNDNRKGYNIGVVDFNLGEYITSTSDKDAFMDVLGQTKLLIQSKGAELSIATLNGFESNKDDEYFRTKWALPIKTQSLIATIIIIEKLLNKTWQSSTYPVYYIGWPHQEGFEQI